MTPDERQMVADLFDRLAALEDAERDPNAERAIRDGLRQAPNAVYALVQTALVQDEALRQANARIEELEAELGIGREPPRQSGFLGSMRDALLGRQEAPRAGSVPSVRPGDAPMGVPPGYRTEPQPMPQGPAPGGAGGSFLGTAAAAAAGVIGGSLLMDSIRSMTGHRGGGIGHAAAGESGSPWGGSGSASGGNLAREAGLDDIGRSGGRDEAGGGRGFGLFDSPAGDTGSDEDYQDDDAPFEEMDDSDIGFDDGDDNA
jgi:hypothetical protein